MRWFLDCPGLRKIMSRNRFQDIMRFLHPVNNKNAIPHGQVGHDRCFKVRGVIRILNNAWRDAYSLEKIFQSMNVWLPSRGASL
jgi:hypothetical protein